MADLVTDADIDAFVAAQRSPRTAAAYRRDLVVFRGFLTEAPAALRGVDLERYRDWLLGHGYRPSTVRRRLAAAAGFLRWRGRQDVTVPSVVEVTSPPAPLGLDDIAALIGGVDGPGTVREGVACLLFASKVATVDGLLALGPEHLGASLRITIDGVEVRFPRSMRGPLELLVRSSGGGRLFGGMSRQTLTRRIRSFGVDCGVEDCTPRALRGSSGQITVEAIALVQGTPVDPALVPPADRLGLIAEAVRERLR